MGSVLDEDSKDSVNISKVKAVYKALKAADLNLLKELMVDEPVWNISPGFPEGGSYRGFSEILGGFYKKLRARVHSFSANPDSFVDGGDTIVVLGHYQVVKIEGSSPVSIRFCHAWHIDNQGKVEGVWQVADSTSF